MSARRGKNQFKRTIDDVLGAFVRQGQTPEFVGAAVRPPLEAATRRYIIDEMLRDLGWDIRGLTKEMVEEARAQGETTLFLDYLGLSNGVPRIIVEAKAWGKPIVAESAAGLAARVGSPPTLSELIAAGINHHKSGKPKSSAPVSAEWFGWLAKLYDYVRAVHNESDHIVRRVVITSGWWMVIFEDPEQTFISADPATPLKIHVFDQDSLIPDSDWIFDLISRSALIKEVDRPIQAAQISGLISTSQISKVFRATWIVRQTHGSHLAPYPETTVYPVILVLGRSGELLIVHDHEASRTTLPSSSKVEAHLKEVAAASNSILASVNAETGATFAPSSLSEFPGFVGDGLETSFVRSFEYPDEFLVATGAEVHYLKAGSSMPSCLGHSWVQCHSQSLSYGNGPLFKASFDPSSFSVTEDQHHCAHRIVHQRRQNDRCKIQPFEQFLCCRSCIFQDVCWTDVELGALPCSQPGTVAQHVAELENANGALNPAVSG